jgi:CheY-like chemotaxis protein/two-component sensor histidine kinase
MLASERHAREEAERMNLMKDEFLATLSHELRTPLNAMSGWTQVALKDPANTDLVAKALDVSARNIRLQSKLIEDLLDMTAIISGKIRLDIQNVDLKRIIDEAIASIRPSVQAKSIRLVTLIDPAASDVIGDASRYQQILWNLLTNAIKFTDKGGAITVVLERVNSHVELSVSDTGIGIDPSFIGRVFDRFSQADSSTRREFGGLGIGLALVKNLVELSGGHARVESRGLGMGSTFIISLPVRAVSGDLEPRSHPTVSEYNTHEPEGAYDLSGIDVLIIDDNVDSVELLRVILERQGARVRIGTSAATGLVLYAERRPDVVVCDIGMPYEDGFDFLRQAKERGFNSPVVALTAFARPEDRIKALRAGFRGHLAKPVDRAEILTFLANIVGRI